MLIENNKLNIQEFKETFSSISWTRLPRQLGPNHTEYFYSGLLETEDKRIQVTIRPSGVMALSETFKNRTPMNGSSPQPGYTGPLVDWGASVEVRVDKNFIDEVEAVAVSPSAGGRSTIDRLEW